MWTRTHTMTKELSGDAVLLPEQQAKIRIDQLLSESGWVIQDRSVFDRHAGPFVIHHGPATKGL